MGRDTLRDDWSDPAIVGQMVAQTNNETLKWVYWLFLLQVMMWNMAWGVSFLFVMPGVITLHVQCCLQALSVQISENSSNKSIAKVVRGYTVLGFAMRKLNESLSAVLMMMFLVFGVEQFIQALFIFQLIKMNAPWMEIRMLLLDVMVKYNAKFGAFNSGYHYNCAIFQFSYAVFVNILNVQVHTARVAHAYYLLSLLEGANNLVIERIKKATATNVKFRKQNRLHLAKQIRSIPPPRVTIGPVRCSRNLLLDGMSVYLNYIVTAALWPLF